jgi:hypothetical protein
MGMHAGGRKMLDERYKFASAVSKETMDSSPRLIFGHKVRRDLKETFS